MIFAEAAQQLASPPCDFHCIYAQSMRSSFFTGFLTLSSFLLAVKTMLIIQLRKDVYEQEGYRAAHAKQRPGEPLYASLQRLAGYLNVNILFALATSAAQFSLGFFECWLTTGVCIGLAFLTICLTVYSVLRIRRELNTLFIWLNEVAEQKKG